MIYHLTFINKVTALSNFNFVNRSVHKKTKWSYGKKNMNQNKTLKGPLKYRYLACTIYNCNLIWLPKRNVLIIISLSFLSVSKMIFLIKQCICHFFLKYYIICKAHIILQGGSGLTFQSFFIMCS